MDARLDVRRDRCRIGCNFAVSSGALKFQTKSAVYLNDLWDNKALDAEPPIASSLKSMLMGGGPVNAPVRRINSSMSSYLPNYFFVCERHSLPADPKSWSDFVEQIEFSMDNRRITLFCNFVSNKHMHLHYLAEVSTKEQVEGLEFIGKNSFAVLSAEQLLPAIRGLVSVIPFLMSTLNDSGSCNDIMPLGVTDLRFPYEEEIDCNDDAVNFQLFLNAFLYVLTAAYTDQKMFVFLMTD